MPKPLNLRKSADQQPTVRGRAGDWRLLVVDDEEEVHSVTRLVLGRTRFMDRGIEILGARSAEQARAILKTVPDIAVILLDVVMESDDAGLKLVEDIRGEFANQAVRIILRTGQPGQAPEERVITDYDINDYKAKSDLTAQKLLTTVIAALRSYQTIIALERNWVGLQKILDSTETLFQVASIQAFASGVLTQLSSFLGCKADGILCVEGTEGLTAGELAPCTGTRVLAACGEYANCLDCSLDSMCKHQELTGLIHRALDSKQTIFSDDYTVVYLGNGSLNGTAALLHGGGPVDHDDRRLLQVFAGKISIALANAVHYQKMITAEQAATTDFLTGLNNRRQLLRLGMPLLAGAKRTGAPLAVAMLDVDHFKKINDNHGHDVGDAVLAHIGGLLKGRFRDSDIVARFGGEEFCVVTPHLPAGQVFDLFDSVRAAVAAAPVFVGELSVPVTVSVGVTTLIDDSLDTMIAAADKQLYRAKNEGRNRVEVA